MSPSPGPGRHQSIQLTGRLSPLNYLGICETDMEGTAMLRWREL